MITLDLTTRKLEAFLSGAAATTNPIATVHYHQLIRNQQGGMQQMFPAPVYTNLAGATETTICPAPSENGIVNIVDSINIYNADTAAVTVIVVVDDNTTNRILVRKTLQIAQALIYENGQGWQIV